MDGIRYQTRSQDAMMEDRYRRLHYEAATQQAQYWAQSPPKPVARFKRHLPAKKKSKDSNKKPEFDVVAYAKHYKDKYGSVSAHSTSAIYGALRAPHYHAIYGPSNMWYASVRSLNRGCPRDMYPAEAYDWRETLYEDVTKEGFPVTPVEIIPGAACACMVRRRVGHEPSLPAHRQQQQRCKHCSKGYPSNGSTNGALLTKKSSLNSDKMKPALVPEEDVKPEPSSRMSAYKKCVSRSSKYKSSVFKGSHTKDPGMISRKSILECDVTAYDLIKKVAKTPVCEIDDSDNDDNLSDNEISKMNRARWHRQQNRCKTSPNSGSARNIENKKLASNFNNSQSDNFLYTESQSVLVGGQRIFTDNTRGSDLDIVYDSLEDRHVRNCDSARWRQLSASEDSICIPAPDYDDSDESDDGTVIAKYRNPKFTYSPPPSRKSNSSHNGLVYGSREISKSMSSLLSEDTYIPHATLSNPLPSNFENMSINCDNGEKVATEEILEDNGTVEDCKPELPATISTPNSKQHDSKYESSSDCSSSGGTLSSEYPTWTSSSSNELKSILKKKKRRDNAIQEPEDASRVFQSTEDSLKDSQKKKQVQFLPGCDEAIFDSVSIEDIPMDEDNDNANSEIIDKQESVNEEGLNQDIYETMSDEETARSCTQTQQPSTNEATTSKVACTEVCLLLRSASLESVRPPASPRRAHRSLPDSPNNLTDDSFCFDFLDKKDKVLSSSRSIFYVPVENNGQSIVPEDPQESEFYWAEPQPEPPRDVVVPSSVNIEKQLITQESVDVLGVMDENAPQYDTDEDVLENEYEHLDPIYEELSDVSNSSKRGVSTVEEPKSFFEGASRIDILSYLEDAKERGIPEGEVIIEEEEKIEEELVSENNCINQKEELLKIVEEDVEKEDLVEMEDSVADTSKSTRISEVERNDSGVGTETSKPARMKQLPSDWEEQLCADCDHQVEPLEDEDSGLLYSPLVCRKCEFRRCERKEIITEFVDTETKYGRDLRIIKDEFYRPMEIAGLLAKDQILSIFLNLDELINANTKFSEKLQDALDIAMEHGDEDYTTVNLGKIFLESSSMLHAFETYCVKQAPASVILSSLEKEKELLRIFLRVSQMENTLLRRMNLPAFLMVPVQRVTRFPLLLSRLHKVTPIHHKDRNALKEAQQKVELHLEHINQQTKGVGGTKIWRRISNISASHRRLGKDIGSIKLRKMALEVLNWKQDETRFVMAGKLLFTQITDYPWNKKGKTIKFTPVHALLIALGKPNSNYRPEISTLDNTILFPRNTGIRDVSLVLMKEKNGRFICVREPLHLGNCVISCDEDCDDVFEVQEYTTKEAYLMKGESKTETKEWLCQLRYHAKDLGPWRKRRNALANIMINGMIRQ